MICKQKKYSQTEKFINELLLTQIISVFSQMDGAGTRSFYETLCGVIRRDIFKGEKRNVRFQYLNYCN